MATTASDLPDDTDERRAHVHGRLGDWLQRILTPERRVTPAEAARQLDLPEPDVRHALNDLVDDDVTPLEREGGEYYVEE